MLDLKTWLPKVVEAHEKWLESYGHFEPHQSLAVAEARLNQVFDQLQQLLDNNYPYGHPNYVAQMLKPPHPAAVIGYLAAMLINPNNHALDGGPATAAMEKESVAELAKMFGMPQHLGHLTSSGTIANMEALWIARESHPGKAIAYSADAHYTHSRMCGVLGVEGIKLATDSSGRLDLNVLESQLATGRIGTVVATLGTTGLGALDPVADIVRLAREYGARVHVDTAYGGFFALIADDSIDGVASAHFRALSEVDSIVVDPHKHGLQPYGCGAVLYSDPAVAKHYQHDSPYTYYSSDELHLGEISLECSRAGAAAAAFWFTIQVLPLSSEGLGKSLRVNRAGALEWADLLSSSEKFELFQNPELDILTYFPKGKSMSEVGAASNRLFADAASGPRSNQIHLATYSVSKEALRLRNKAMELDAETTTILRSTVMKPESASRIAEIHRTLEGWA